MKYLLQEGYALVPVTEIVLKGECFTEHTGRTVSQSIALRLLDAGNI